MTIHCVDAFQVKPADLLNAWRDAVRAGQLAERLATTAAKSAQDAEARALVAAEMAALAEEAAAALAQALRNDELPAARRTVESANAAEVNARTAYHVLDGWKRNQQQNDGSAE